MGEQSKVNKAQETFYRRVPLICTDCGCDLGRTSADNIFLLKEKVYCRGCKANYLHAKSLEDLTANSLKTKQTKRKWEGLMCKPCRPKFWLDRFQFLPRLLLQELIDLLNKRNLISAGPGSTMSILGPFLVDTPQDDYLSPFSVHHWLLPYRFPLSR